MPRNNNVGPLPGDGDVYEEPDNQLELDLDDGQGDSKPEPKLDPRDQELQALRSTVNELQSSIASLRSPQPKAPEPEPEPDWEDLMFKDPRKYHQMLRDSVKKEISTELRGEYQKDQGTQQFWSAFYKDHKDLEGDDDLVRATLQANLADLAPMPVKAAGDKLAELTRNRILRYTGGKIPSGKKAVAEGQGNPTPKKVAPEPSTVVTLSQLIRARKERRMNNKGTAA